MSKFRLIFGLFLIVVGLCSCRPGEVLSRDEMTDVLYDIHIAETLADGSEEPVTNEWLRGMNPTDFRDMAYQSVLKKHKITEEAFFSSVAYYSKHLRIYIKIYADIDQRLADLMTEIRSGKYSTETPEELLSHSKLDSVKMHAWYAFFDYKPMEEITRPLYLIQDSIPSLASVLTGQWIHNIVPDTISYLVATPKPLLKDTILQIDTLSTSTDMMVMPRKTHTGIREAKNRIMHSEKKIRNR